MREKRDANSKLYHFSYDKKNPDYNSEDIRNHLIWFILNQDINAIVDSPTESTMIFESTVSYEDLETSFRKRWVDELYYVFSEVRQDDDNHYVDIEWNFELAHNFVENVERIREEIKKNQRLANY